MHRLAILVVILVLAASSLASARPSPQPVPRPAPAWDVSEWINSQKFELNDLKGQVVIIEFFQLWCPGCNAFSIPLIKKWHQRFAKEIENKRLKIVSIHTVFEGFDFQSPARLRKFLKRKDIRHPVGVDRPQAGTHVPRTMDRFGTSGTPEMAIVDKAGYIRFQEFGGFQIEPAERLIRRLLKE